MKTYVLSWFAAILCLLPASLLAVSGAHPATVGQGPDSFAMQLHYPPKERAGQKSGAVKFYCEVSPEGKAGHISTLCGREEARFGSAVNFALRHGRFNPATVDGKAVTVLVGGTILFLMNNGKPTIAVTLATAENDKIAAMSNYVQPQILDSDALFRRKIFSHRDKYHLQYGAHPAVAVRVHVDAQGKMAGKKIESETPANGGRGRLLLDVMDEEKFVAAQSNGQPVAGDLELAVNFEHMHDPDSGPALGSLLKKDD